MTNKLHTSLLKAKKVPLYIKGIIIGLLGVFLTGFVILIFPLWPKIDYALKNKDPNKIDYPISFAQGNIGIESTENVKPIPTENRLVIPKIAVDSEILEGSSLDVLLSKEGVWREPFTTTPESEGNMVIAGHRFQYLPPNTNTFYNLEELAEGDKIIVFWKSKSYVYQIYKTFDVTPDETGIRDSNPDIPYEITIYTCTPLYTSQNRFVVKAKLIS